VPSDGSSAQYCTTKGLWTNEFTRYQVEFTASANHTKLEIDLGACAGEVYFDNVSLKEKDTDVNLIANGNFETQGTAGWSSSTSWAGTTLKQVEYVLGEINEPGILVSIGEAGWRTFRTGSNVKIASPLKAYIATYVAAGNYVKLTEVTDIPSWQPVLIEGAKGDYMMKSPATADGFPYGDNDLKANGASALPGDGTLYGLAKVGGVVGFYKIASTSEVPAWAIYLQISDSARDFLGFSADETTAIRSIESVENNQYYNLQGVRVAQPTKGLYIVNGKKVILK
jgi:hypothetical protein